MVTGAPAAPGVSGAGGCDLAGALIFTSNDDQSGALNCAHLPQWRGEPIEGFGLPEAGRVSYLELYGRDGRVAFHDTERGLEAFSRELLIASLASTPTLRLAGAITLRDLAWADHPYVCVRDDLGNRWLANVRVLDVSATRSSTDARTSVLASVEVIEVTREPCAIDPALAG